MKKKEDATTAVRVEQVIHSELGPILPALGIWSVGDRGRAAPASVRFCGFWHLQIFLGGAFL